jgi:hypothetical protein
LLQLKKHDIYSLFLFKITTFNKKILNEQEREKRNEEKNRRDISKLRSRHQQYHQKNINKSNLIIPKKITNNNMNWS